MRELLERWARLETSRCSEFDDHMGGTGLQVTWSGTPMRAIPDDYPLDALDKALVLAATIEAIEAHKGRFTLKRDIGDSHYFAAVRFQSQKTPRIAKSYQPAAALLLAYLAAIEAEAGS